jgi:enterochelin esterase family protein
MRASLPLVIVVCFAALCHAEGPDDQYVLGPESQRQEGVPQGKVTKHEWQSKVFEGTIREFYLYVPAEEHQKDQADFAAMVFQDGHTYVKDNGDFCVPVVLDNLIHKGELPPIVGVFINPGHKGDGVPRDPWRANNRSFEYDTLSDQYARFLIEEMLPEAARLTGLALTDDPDRRAICGISSGGICAWTAAWERPDAFRKVLSHVGSFTNIRGGHDYHAQIRKTPNKPIRVFLQDGKHDLDNRHGNWWLANLEMEAALKFKRYDYKFVGGEGGHSGKHGGAILPDSLRWLWRSEPAK